MFHPPIAIDTRNGAAGGQAKGMDRHGQPTRVAISDLYMTIDHHILSHKAHGPHANGIAQILKLLLQGRDFGV